MGQLLFSVGFSFGIFALVVVLASEDFLVFPASSVMHLKGINFLLPAMFLCFIAGRFFRVLIPWVTKREAPLCFANLKVQFLYSDVIASKSFPCIQDLRYGYGTMIYFPIFRG